MTAAPFVIPDKTEFNFVNATNLLAANPANFKMALVTSAFTPDQTNDELWGGISAYEIAAGGGYSTGGASLTNVSLTLASGKAKFTSDPVSWSATGSGFPAWRRAVIYYNGTLNGKVNPIVGYFLGDATNIDVPATTTANSPLSITPNVAGILTVGN